MSIEMGQEVGPAAAGNGSGNGAKKRRGLPGLGLIKGLTVTLKHMLQPSITQEYPDEKPDLPARTRGVIALKQENCTVCWKCSRECPDWCIYIESHKETHEPASGGRARSVKVLDRFAIDYSLCMYCGICVEVCPFDALFWSPEFEYAEYDVVEMIHEKDRLQEWTYWVKPPPPLEEGAVVPMETEEDKAITTGGGEELGARPPSADQLAAPGAHPPAEAMPARAEPGTPPSQPPGPQAATTAGAGPAAPSAETMAPAAAAGGERHEVEPDQETHDRVLQEELAKGTDRRVAEGRAKAAAVRAARAKAGG
ncbi:MAG TPA: NADH-quinone oxidoreductase subunit I [Actinomycetota bacterium]|nr:NADH-quinone oxidoreductase subunit I [Actinomycetota bacterium]